MLDPGFQAKIQQIKEKYRATKTYKDDNYFIDPKSWTIEKQIKQDVKDHVSAVNEAIDVYDRKEMVNQSMRVAIAAEASSRGVPYEVVAKEWIERDLKDLNKLAKKN